MQVPLATQTAYQDLLERHRTHAVREIGGTPFLKQLPKGTYWYTRQKIGDRPVDRYVGPDTKDVRKRIEALQEAAEDEKNFERDASLLVAQLRAAGLPVLDRQTGSILAAMVRAGVFRLGGTLVGTHAFRLYGSELGYIPARALAVTEDVDIAAFENLKLVIQDAADPSLQEVFKLLSLVPVPGIDAKQRPTKWKLKTGGATVEFLAPLIQSENEIVRLDPLGVHAQALPFLNFLIADPIPAVGLYRNGVLVQIPRPERYAVHKLIVAQRRSGPGLAKAPKDLAQAEALFDILAQDRPQELALAYETARANGPKWREALDAALKRKPALKEILDAL